MASPVKACRHCLEGRVRKEKLYNEALEVCLSCGAAVSLQDDIITTTLPNPNSSNLIPKHLVPKTTARRGELRKIFRATMSKLAIPSRSGVFTEAHSLLSRVRLTGRRFDLHCVSAACAFVALRGHRRDVTLTSLAERLHLPAGDAATLGRINDVLRHLRRDLGVRVPGREDDDGEGDGATQLLVERVRSALAEGEFWSADGSRVDNAFMCWRTVALLALLRRLPTSKVRATPEFIAAAAFIRYKAERLPQRSGMSVPKFLQECGLTVDPKKTSKAANTLMSLVKELVAALPYLDESEVRAMSPTQLLHHLSDVFQHEALVVAEVQGVERSLLPSAPASQPTPSLEDPEDEPIDDKEIEGYIRSSQEVEELRQLHAELCKKTNA